MTRLIAALAVTLSIAAGAAQADTLSTITMQGQNVTVHGIWDAR
jgi:hypothetical protein